MITTMFGEDSHLVQVFVGKKKSIPKKGNRPILKIYFYVLINLEIHSGQPVYVRAMDFSQMSLESLNPSLGQVIMSHNDWRALCELR